MPSASHRAWAAPATACAARRACALYIIRAKAKKIVDSSDTRVREEKKLRHSGKAPCPAVLAEQCFLSNSGDYEAWATPQGCQHAAHVYYEAICRYFGTQPIAQA